MTGDAGTPAVHAEGLCKLFGDREAVTGVDLSVRAGEIFGFLGPNGAGKSTTISMLCTLLRPTLGHAAVAGHDVVREPDEVRRRIGLVFQESTVDGDLTAEDNLRFHAELFGMPRREARRTIAAMLDMVDLTERAGTRVRTFSGGMRRRLEIVRGLLHSPHVLFLDEPTTGLDPQTRVAIWEHLHRMRDERGTTLFLTTHQMEEAEHCDRIAIIDNGEIVAEGATDELKAVIGEDLITLRTGDDDTAVKVLRKRFRLDAAAGPGGVRLRAADGAAFVPTLCAELTVPVHSVTVAPPTLDDVFLHYTGRTIREAETGPMTMADLVARRR
ncbi:ATP-binding cassette domain-containing protein [Streptomyces uncialis]|uniref:ATP-binding cassette domain-containing protein n=1 Tax=Streptomyces uncialis TaxID=1048205 RepID=UPI00225A5FFA|nr:ATP-binding cassette domain-containing protein [Streptomyces uncialis]MCX4661902.1 ATP-binding cassette domain-containing protein [Streptomyces uncialis]